MNALYRSWNCEWKAGPNKWAFSQLIQEIMMLLRTQVLGSIRSQSEFQETHEISYF